MFFELFRLRLCRRQPRQDPEAPNLEARYRTLIEQIPAVVFMVYLDRGVGEAYVNPQIETMLGFSREEWLEDPVRWYERIHPDDKHRWSAEAAEMFLSGKPLRSVYRVIARDGHVVSFHCDARMVRRPDGRPWFIHGVGFDITDLKRAEEALHEERNFASAVVDTVGALVLVLDPGGRIVRFNRACEQTTGYASSEVIGKQVWDLFAAPEETARFREIFEQLRGRPASGCVRERLGNPAGRPPRDLLVEHRACRRERRPGVCDPHRNRRHRSQAAGTHHPRNQRQGTAAHRPGSARWPGPASDRRRFHEQGAGTEAARKSALPEAAEAAKIVALVNEAIHRTRELSRGLLPVLSDARGLMSALERLALEVEDLFQVSCRFECDQPVLIHESDMATHLYHIAQEAVNNALRARPSAAHCDSTGGRREIFPERG